MSTVPLSMTTLLLIKKINYNTNMKIINSLLMIKPLKWLYLRKNKVIKNENVLSVFIFMYLIYIYFLLCLYGLDVIRVSSFAQFSH